MILYHFTSQQHLPKILRDGALRMTESNLSRTRLHAGPDVVWLTADEQSNGAEHGLDHASVDKTAVRFTVDLDDAVPWLTWSREHGITKSWARALEDGRQPETWWVVERSIPQFEWLAVDARVEVDQ